MLEVDWKTDWPLPRADWGWALLVSVFAHVLGLWVVGHAPNRHLTEMPGRFGVSAAQQSPVLTITMVSSVDQPGTSTIAPVIDDSPQTIVEPSQQLPAVDPSHAHPDAAIEKFYSISEVDAPASPTTQWMLDEEVLPSNVLTRIDVEVWISSTGKLVHWELLGSSKDDPIALHALQNFKATEAIPAIRNGVPVASVRRIQLLISPD